LADQDWGAFYEELWVGLGTELAFSNLPKVHVWTRGETETVFFFGDLGLITAQKIQCLEFDGWELFEAVERRVSRYEEVADAQRRIVELLRSRHSDDLLLVAAQAKVTKKLGLDK